MENMASTISIVASLLFSLVSIPLTLPSYYPNIS